MTEADARALLHNWPGVGGLEARIAGTGGADRGAGIVGVTHEFP